MIGERFVSFFGALALVALTGCAGARTQVTADTARYPVSFSRAVRDSEGDVVGNERLKKVGTFESKTTAWGMLYSAIPLTPKTDISKLVNAQIAAHGGDAIVNLWVRGARCGADFAFLLSALPVFPGYAHIHLESDIVKVVGVRQ